MSVSNVITCMSYNAILQYIVDNNLCGSTVAHGSVKRSWVQLWVGCCCVTDVGKLFTP